MKSVYSDISASQGFHIAGICSMLITPREWLAADPVIDFETGRVILPVTLLSNRFWMQLELVPRDFYFEENEKTNKSGPYYEITTGGILNTHNYGVQQVLENLRYREFVVIITDRNMRRKIIGDTKAGMLIKKLHSIKNSPASEESLKIDLAIELENPAPYYNVDNTRELLNNFIVGGDGFLVSIDGNSLIDSNGDILVNSNGDSLLIN